MKKLVLTAIAAASLLPGINAAEKKAEVRLLSERNALVSLDSSDGRYVLVPVEETAPMAHIRILVDGKIDEKINVPLAEHKIDYYVPVELESRPGSKVLLDIRTQAERNNLRDARDAAWVAEMRVSDTFDTANREKHRPLYHHTPLYGWMNDPNGMFYKDGVWHLAYQLNPYGSKWENMTWGHSTSNDLIHWDHQPILLRPDALGAVFSGSAVVDKDNTAGFGKDAVIAIYTSADASQTQSLAFSTDNGMTYKRYEGNPIIAYDRESRDPNMFWDEEHGNWVLTLASALDHEMLIFNSKDLKNWELTGKFGKGYGSQAGVWECPDLIKLPVRGTDKEKWVLLCNLNPGGIFGGSATQYFVGEFDGKNFVADTAPEVTKWMDYGKDHYATVSFSNAPDGRHVVIGWMSNWQYANELPTLQYRSANTLPRDLSLFEGPDGEIYLASAPSPEVDQLRGKEMRLHAGSLSKKGKTFRLPAENDGVCEIEFDVEMKHGESLNLTLGNASGEKVEMTLNSGDDTFSMDRRLSGKVDFSENFPCVTTAPARNGTGRYQVRLFIDRSSIEAFDSEGRFAMTNIVFPENPYSTLTLSSSGGKVDVKRLSVYPIVVKSEAPSTASK